MSAPPVVGGALGGRFADDMLLTPQWVKVRNGLLDRYARLESSNSMPLFSPRPVAEKRRAASTATVRASGL